MRWLGRRRGDIPQEYEELRELIRPVVAAMRRNYDVVNVQNVAARLGVDERRLREAFEHHGIVGPTFPDVARHARISLPDFSAAPAPLLRLRFRAMRIRVALPPATHEALAELSVRERRDARDQAALLIIRALARRGLVSSGGLQRSGEELEPASR